MLDAWQGPRCSAQTPAVSIHEPRTGLCVNAQTPNSGAYSAAVTDLAALNWDDLRTFLLAAQAKTLAGAERAAGVQHTTIARRLSSLENSLGAPLFLRRPDGLVLTPLGEMLVPLAREVERNVSALHEAVASRRSRVRLAANFLVEAMRSRAGRISGSR